MKVLTIIIGILLVIVGFFCLFTPGLTLLSVGWLLGLMLVLAGISIIVDYFVLRKAFPYSGWNLFLGIVTLVMGGILLINQGAQMVTDVIAIYMLGVWLLVMGIVRVVEAIQMRKTPGSGWGWILALGIIMAIIGVYSFFHPTVAAFTLAWLIGIYIIIAGVDLITFATTLHKTTGTDGESHWTIANQ